MKDSKTIRIVATVVGVILAIGLIFIGFKVFSSVFTRASDVEPRDVIIGTVTQNSANISWSTGVVTQGVVEYGTSPTALNFFAPDQAATQNHSIDLTLLSPTTTYYFQIRVGQNKFDNGGVPWTFTTKGSSPTTQAPTLAPTSPASSTLPTPVQTLEIPATSCTFTDCTQIRSHLGKGCSTQDYFRCLKKLTPTP